MSFTADVVCLGLTAAGALVAAVRVRRGQRRLAARWVGWALLPLGALLAGVATLAVRIGSAFSRWLAGLVLNPFTWAGVVLFGLGVLLLLVTGAFGDRSAERGKTDRSPEPVRRGSERPAVETARPRAPGPAGGMDDMEGLGDVEEILRRRGIS